jgi:hypothetical protein
VTISATLSVVGVPQTLSSLSEIWCWLAGVKDWQSSRTVRFLPTLREFKAASYSIRDRITPYRLTRQVSVLIRGKVLVFRSPDLPMSRSPDSCSPLPASFSQTPPPHRGFVANKDQTPIRPRGHRAVEDPFSCSFGVESRSIRFAIWQLLLPVGRRSQTPCVLAKG